MKTVRMCSLLLILGVLAQANGCGPGGASNNPAISLTSLSPASATVGASAQTLTINGTGFLSSSTVTFNGTPHTATFVNGTQLTITLTAGDEATAGMFSVVVTNPTSGGGASISSNFMVKNPAPSITGLSPASVTVGAAAQTLTVNGTNFLSTSTVSFNGAVHTTTFVNGTQLTISLSAAEQTTVGSYPVVVTNPAPGGGTSNAFSFANNYPVPGITGLSPVSATAGAAAQTLTINGTGFLPASTVTFNGTPHPATFVNAAQLTIALSAGDQTTVGSYPLAACGESRKCSFVT
jgi:hypothetical protein